MRCCTCCTGFSLVWRDVVNVNLQLGAREIPLSEVVAAYARSGLQSDDDSALMRASFNLSVYYEQVFMPRMTEFTMKYSEGNVQVVA